MKRKTLKRVLKYIKKDIWLLIGSIIFAIFTVFFTLLIPIVTGKLIDLLNLAVNGGIFIDFNKEFTHYLIIILLSLTLGSISQLIMSLFNNHLTYKIIKRIRTDAFNKLQSLPFSFLDKYRTGEIISRLINDVDTFADGLLMGFTQAFVGIATIIGTLVFMFMINWIIALLVVVISPLSLLVARFIAIKTYKMFTDQAIIRGEETALIEEMVNNLKVVKAYNQEENNNKRFNEINDLLYNCSFKATFYSSLTNPSTRFVNSIVYSVVCFVGALMCLPTLNLGLGLTVGMLTTFLSYANQYTKPFNEISSVLTELQNALACCNRVFFILDQSSEIPDAGNMHLKNALGNISIKNVNFSYDVNNPLIENFNLEVKQGMKIAIVGPTGCGKTTLINLLMRFYDVDSGSISLDKTDIRNITRHSLRHNYGMVLQETWLKEDTVFNNIRLGKKDATLEEVKQACKKVHADSFISRLPLGYDTIIKDDGSFSLGEKQLLCIARIMLLKPNLLILDEATSSIDTRTEVLIDQAFLKLMEGKTTFIVAHRLATIKNADMIIVMSKGHIIEQGTHEELISKRGFYYDLYNSQFVE